MNSMTFMFGTSVHFPFYHGYQQFLWRFLGLLPPFTFYNRSCGVPRHFNL